jgi:tetratricopeptide (TPR) repeat protein
MLQRTCLLSITIGLSAIGLMAQPSLGMSAAEVAKIAKGAAVTINSDASHGSGIIIQQQGSQYLVLTAAHVVKGDRKFEVITADERRHQLQPTSVQPLAGVDLAVVKFTSDRSYPVPKLGNANNSTEGTTVYVSGFPIGTEAIDRTVFNFTDGKVTANSSKPLKDGYAIIYSNNTLPGMSGGGVFNGDGELIAIHGRGDVDTQINTSELDPNIRIKTGFNLGIPISTFQNLATKIGINVGTAIASVNPAQSKADDFVLAGFERVSKKDLAGSVSEFSKAIAIKPKLVTAWVWRGTCLLLMGDFQKAITNLNGAIALNPKKVEAYVHRASAYAQLGNRAQTIADLDRAVSLNSQSAFVYGSSCSLKFQVGDLKGAIEDCNRAIQFNPQDSLIYLNRGMARLGLGDRLGALTDYNRSINFDRSVPNAYYNRGLLKVELEDRQGASADLQAAAKLYLKFNNKAKYQLTLGKITELENGKSD